MAGVSILYFISSNFIISISGRVKSAYLLFLVFSVSFVKAFNYISSYFKAWVAV